MRAERLQRIGTLWNEGPEVDAADGGFSRPVVRQDLFQPPHVVERQSNPARRGAERSAHSRVDRPVRRQFRRLALQRLARELVIGRQRWGARRQELEAQMSKIERADPQRRADPLQQPRRRRRLADERDIALHCDERIERVEKNADSGGEPQSL